MVAMLGENELIAQLKEARKLVHLPQHGGGGRAPSSLSEIGAEQKSQVLVHFVLSILSAGRIATLRVQVKASGPKPVLEGSRFGNSIDRTSGSRRGLQALR